MKTRVQWVENALFLAETGSGHTVTMDGAPEAGGRNLAARPMEMVLVGLGGCTAFDVVSILRKGRHAVTGCDIDIEAERSDSVPKVFTQIKLHYHITGHNLKPAAVERAVKLSAEKYCSVSMMLEKSAKLAHDFTITDAGPAAE